MKKLLSFILVAFFSATLFGQTIVPTTPTNRNVIIEEFTGKTCQFCPDGHRIVHELMLAKPGRVWGINVHQGGYASGTPNYTTIFGDALWNNAAGSGTGLGYPAGTVNREKITGQTLMGSGSNYMYDRGRFVPGTNVLLTQPSSVNIAAKGTIDGITKKLTVLVEVYYTGNAVSATNKVTVALLQSNILGPQTGGATWFPEMMEGGQYRHNHMLRHFLTGQWGAEVTPTTAGSFWTQTFEYDIPVELNSIPVVLADLDVVVYIAETNKDIITGNHASLTGSNFPPSINSKIESVSDASDSDCSNNAKVALAIKNIGGTPITSVEVKYTVAGGADQTATWSGAAIQSLETGSIIFPTTVTVNEDQVVNAQITKINGSAFTSNTKSGTIRKNVGIGEPAILVLGCDKFMSETTFKIFNPDGSVLLEGGPWNNGNLSIVTIKEFSFIPTELGCHKVVVYDSNGNGMNSGSGAGYIRVYDGDGNIMISHNGIFSTSAELAVDVTSIPNIFINTSTGNAITIVPNPVKDIMNIQGIYETLEIMSNTGQIVATANGQPNVNVSNLAKGVYFVKVQANGQTHTFKVVK